MISYCWRTRTIRCITANVLQRIKVDTQCDKLATKLSWQCFPSKVANFQPLHCPIWHLRWGTSRLSYANIFGIKKLESPGYQVALFRRSTFSHFSRIPTCDRQMDGQTDTDTWRQLIPTLTSAARVKILFQNNWRKKLEWELANSGSAGKQPIQHR